MCGRRSKAECTADARPVRGASPGDGRICRDVPENVRMGWGLGRHPTGCSRRVTRPASIMTQYAEPVSCRYGVSRHWRGIERLGEELGGEFDPGSGSTLAACLMHASRTGCPSGHLRGGRVRNTWVTCPLVGASLRKRRVIPHKLASRVGGVRKAARRRWRGPRPISLLVG